MAPAAQVRVGCISPASRPSSYPRDYRGTISNWMGHDSVLRTKYLGLGWGKRRTSIYGWRGAPALCHQRTCLPRFWGRSSLDFQSSGASSVWLYDLLAVQISAPRIVLE